MAAAADRLAGDLLDCVSPELVLVDPELSAEVRRRLDTPADTLTRLERAPVEPLPALELVEIDPAPLDSPTPDVPEPLSELVVTDQHEGIDDLIVVPEEESAPARHTSRLYPVLPAPPEDDSGAEDATDAVLRHIRDHFEDEPTPRRKRRLLVVASLATALCAITIFVADVQFGVYELPAWFQG